MMMETESEKYKKVLDLLRNSKPKLNSAEDMETEVIKRISKMGNPKFTLSDLIDFIFGWVYIGWVRRSLITISAILIIVFIWQQGIILKRIDLLSRQTIVTDRENVTTPESEIEKIMTDYKNSQLRFSSKTIRISEKEMKELLESINELQIRYKDLENVIEQDPELKSYIEKKLKENNRIKTNL